MNNDLDLYLKNTFRLARTITIKSEDIAETMNNYLVLAQGDDIVDKTDPYTWKYYVNLSGEYHSYTSPTTGVTYTTDQPMSVLSLDDGTTIDFKKDVLINHPFTLKEYRKGGNYFKSLVNKYPEQLLLIQGILFPVDITTVIESPNFKILTYDKTLVEEQEDSLIEELNEWVYRYQSRWDVRAFKLTDNLYQAAQLAQLYAYLVPKILNLRLKRCLTYEAHSFHVKNFLISHYKIGHHIEKLNNREVLWLYKNIRYIERRLGKYDTLELLGEKLLKPMDISLYKLDIKQNSEKRDSGSPGYMFNRYTVNGIENDPSKNQYTLEQTLRKETNDPLVGGMNGLEFVKSDEDLINNKIELTNYSDLNTKMIESKLLDYGDISPLKRLQIVLDNWVYLSNNNTYTAITNFTDPNTGEQYLLNQYQSVLLFIYLISVKYNIKNPKIPTWKVSGVTREDANTILMSYTMTSDTGLGSIVNNAFMEFPEKPIMNSTEDFIDYTKRVYNYYFKNWVTVSNTHDIHNSAYLKSMFDRVFLRTDIEFNDTGRPYSDWLKENNLELEIDTNYDVSASLKQLAELNTGFRITEISQLEEVLRSVMKIFNRLLAYTTQNITEFNKKPLSILNQNYLRPSKNPIGLIEEPNLIFKCMYELDIDLTMRCDAGHTPRLEVFCGDEYIPSLEIDCSLQTSPQEILLDCSLHRAPQSPYLDCSLPTPPQDIDIACGGVTTPLISINDIITSGPNIIDGHDSNVGDLPNSYYTAINSNINIGVIKYGIDPQGGPFVSDVQYVTIHSGIPISVIDEQTSIFGLGPNMSGRNDNINSNVKIIVFDLNKDN
jgi:hypothetical protein